MKIFFDTPGGPQFESLDVLAIGMTRKAAALLFYQTCGIRTHSPQTSNQLY
jgi:cohesin complex subunit SCC1